MGLDIANGQCKNNSIPQNITFGQQGGVLGNNGAVALGATRYVALVYGTLVGLLLTIM